MQVEDPKVLDSLISLSVYITVRDRKTGKDKQEDEFMAEMAKEKETGERFLNFSLFLSTMKISLV